MPSYKELQAQIEVPTRQTEEAGVAELHAVIEEVRAKVAKYRLTERTSLASPGQRGGSESQRCPAEISGSNVRRLMEWPW